jgi:hypothetical protein
MKSTEFIVEVDITPRKPPQHKIKRPKAKPTVEPTLSAAIADGDQTVARPVAPKRPMRMPK